MSEIGIGGRRFVLFRLGSEEYGLPIEQVSSIIRYEPATPVPHAPASVDGIINLRGNIVPVVNLKRRLLGQDVVPTATTRIVVAESSAGKVGLVVDGANEVCTLAEEDIMAPPDTAMTPETAEAIEAVASVGGRLVILLDLDRALPTSEYGRVAEEVEADV